FLTYPPAGCPPVTRPRVAPQSRLDDMFCMGRPRSIVALLAVVMAALASAPAALASGPIQTGLGKPISVTTLKPGVTLTHYRVTVMDAGVLRTQQIYKVAWTIGNSHVVLDSMPLG